VQIESLINFPEENINLSLIDLQTKLENLEKKVDSLLSGSEQARVLKEGLNCVICGKTNAGKSTLFNRLLKEERVIVSKFPGTTRDVIEETINIKGVSLRIYDTAGILEPRDLISKKALEKTSQVFTQADLVILLLDGSKVLNKDDFFLLEKVKNKNVILVINKSDLTQRLEARKLREIKGLKIKMSALKDRGLRQLEQAVYRNVHKGKIDRENIIFLSQYQREVLKKVKDDVHKAVGFFKQGRPIDFIDLALKSSLDNLGKITGQVLSEEILESIFNRFCIGK
jgi:tRNA modification GTPase